MIGNELDWWNQNTPEDDILMQLVEIAKKLVHLPQLEEIPEKQGRSLAGSCVTYFGSFEGARKKVAKLLYGRADLTCPDDLLPSEAKLPLAEQEAIRERRRSYYQEMLKKLSEPDALAKMRRKQAEVEKRRKYEKETAGYTVRKIPIQTRRELRAVIGDEELRRKAKSTSGLFVWRPEKQKPADEEAKLQKGARFQKAKARKRRVTSFREQWEKSSLNPANHPKTTTRRLAPSAKMDSRGLADHPKPAPEKLPPNVQMSADCSKIAHEQSPPNVRECPQEQANHLEPALEQLMKPLVELLMQQLQGATITIEGGNDEMNWWGWNAEMLKQLKDKTAMIEGGNDEMPRQRIAKETILNALSEMVKHYGHMPTRMEMEEYLSAHKDEHLPGFVVTSKNLGPKDTWMAQLEEYQRSKMPEAGGAPGGLPGGLSDEPVPDSPDGSPGGASGGPVSDSPGGPSLDSVSSGGAAGEPGATPGSEPELERGDPCSGQGDLPVKPGATPGLGADEQAGAQGGSGTPDVSVGEPSESSATVGGQGEPGDDTKTYHGADGLEPVPSAKVTVLDLNLQSVQLNFRLNGQDYTMRLRFGGK